MHHAIHPSVQPASKVLVTAAATCGQKAEFCINQILLEDVNMK
ncbi:MAG: hypothetical protein P4M11_02580 [Candidatus Pacebacteria bacterium]|nr:hypothetical protein [Candidatus Paceibacterota bacterium]